MAYKQSPAALYRRLVRLPAPSGMDFSSWLDPILEQVQTAICAAAVEQQDEIAALDWLNMERAQELFAAALLRPVVPLSTIGDIEHIPPRPIIIDGIARAGEVVLLAGQAKAKKTWLALDLAIACSAGGRWGGTQSCEPCPVLYVDAECPREVIAERMRLRMLDAGKPTTEACRRVQLLSARGTVRRSIESACDTIRQGICQSGAGLCIIDTLSAYFPVEDENDNAEATAAMGSIVAVAEDLQCVIMMIHHTPKGAAGSQRATVDMAAGAGAWARRADTVVSIREIEGETLMDVRARSLPAIERACIRWGPTMAPRFEPAPDTSDIPTVAPTQSKFARKPTKKFQESLPY